MEQQPKALRERLRSTIGAALVHDGKAIQRMRDELGYAEPFAPYERYLKYREMASANFAR